MIPLASIAARTLGKRIGKIVTEQMNKAGILTSYLIEIFKNHKLMKVFQKENFEKIRAFQMINELKEKSQKINEAAGFFKKAIQYDPNLIFPYVNLGLLNTIIGNHSQAIQYLEVAVTIEHENIKAHYNLGLVYEIVDRYQDAVNEYQKVILLNPSHPEIHNNLAWALIESKRYIEALVPLKKSIQLNPTNRFF